MSSTAAISAAAAPAAAPRKSPAEFVTTTIGSHVVVKLHSGIEYHGRLTCLDGYMNIVLEDTHEVADGRVTNKYGDAFVRGNNVLYIAKSSP
ncbi:hypothetical protein GGF31_006565 [Allomyces arbusculus]|nr:hypothetical protein GGF31_006565 [Allomyces arbusculus]